MPPEIPGVRGLVARTLLLSPDTSSRELYALAVGRYPALADLTVQQFHGRYVLQVRRELKRHPPRRPRVVEASTDAGERREAAGETPPSPPSPPGSGAKGSLLERLAATRESAARPAGGPGTPSTDSAAPSAGTPPRSAGTPPPAVATRTDPAGSRDATAEAPAESAAEGNGAVAEPAPSLVERARPSPEIEPPPPADPRAATRTLFYRLALELEMAETRDELVRVVFAIDRYVDEALALVRR